MADFGWRSTAAGFCTHLLQDPGIVILDEALIAWTRHRAPDRKAVDRMIAGRTSLVIAHRLKP